MLGNTPGAGGKSHKKRRAGKEEANEGDPPTDDRVVKRMSSCPLHPAHKLTCNLPMIQLKTSKMFGLRFQ